jgi:homogentisate 1,2-dioxygenase
MSGHGPDAQTHEGASKAELKPTKVGEGSMAFMFESCLMLGLTEEGEKGLQDNYSVASWGALKPRFQRPEVT